MMWYIYNTTATLQVWFEINCCLLQFTHISKLTWTNMDVRSLLAWKHRPAHFLGDFRDSVEIFVLVLFCVLNFTNSTAFMSLACSFAKSWKISKGIELYPGKFWCAAGQYGNYLKHKIFFILITQYHTSCLYYVPLLNDAFRLYVKLF